MTADDALRWCTSATEWASCKERAMEAAEKVDLSFLLSSECHARCIEQVPELIDWRQDMSMFIKFSVIKIHTYILLCTPRRNHFLRLQVPERFTPCLFCGEGDCLFCAVSIALFGNDRHHKDLRIAAICHAVLHFEHYLEMVS